MVINCLYCQKYAHFKWHFIQCLSTFNFFVLTHCEMCFIFFFLQTDEIDGTLLGTLNGERNSQSNIDAINRQLNLSLPATPPSGLTQQQLKRRHIFAAIVSSECSYVATLQRLVNVSNSCKMPFRLLRFRNVWPINSELIKHQLNASRMSIK